METQRHATVHEELLRWIVLGGKQLGEMNCGWFSSQKLDLFPIQNFWMDQKKKGIGHDWTIGLGSLDFEDCREKGDLTIFRLPPNNLTL